MVVTSGRRKGKRVGWRIGTEETLKELMLCFFKLRSDDLKFFPSYLSLHNKLRLNFNNLKQQIPTVSRFLWA